MTPVAGKSFRNICNRFGADGNEFTTIWFYVQSARQLLHYMNLLIQD